MAGGRCTNEVSADLVIVGGGASAALLIDAIRRVGPGIRARIVVYEGRHPPGRGVPYRTADRAHRMNVPASRLSVDPDDPGHLLRWLLREGEPAAPDDYIERGLYGRYLEHVLSGRGRRAPEVEVEVVRASVIRIDRVRSGFEVTSSGGGRLVAPRVVLAVGVPDAPSPLPIDHRLAGDRSVVEDPWAPGALDGPAGERWLVAGTGLTMVDVALTILRRPGTTVDAVSRHGLLPRVHPAPRRRAVHPLDLPAGPLTAASVRRSLVDHAASEPHGWPASVDLFRDESEDIWPRLPEAEQAKLLRRIGPWNVHRHRMAPQVANRLDTVIAAGRLRIHAGHIRSIGRDGDQLGACVWRRGRATLLRADRLAVCVGPPSDVSATTDPLLRHLLDTGQAAVGPHRLGFAVDACGTVLDGSGWPVGGLSVLGALRKGTAFETTAIPELREQATALARQIVPPPR